jgi:threonine dehydrogenase-like Zn-dependent dehydrogenase
MRGIAATFDSAAPQWVELPEPAGPRAGEVLCRTLELGVCGTDREILQSRRPLVPSGEPWLVLGHECLARVEAVGEGVEQLRPGDLVVPVVRRARDEAAGESVPAGRVDLLAFGRYTERGIVEQHGFSVPWWTDRPKYLYPIDQALAPWAVLTEPFSVAEKGINEALAIQRARLGDAAWQAPPPRVLVTGMGPIGFAALAASITRGWPTTLYGRDEADSFRARLAEQFGARYLPDAEARFDQRQADSEGFDLILECTGSDRVMLAAGRALASRGVMVWLGSSRRPKAAELNVAQLMRDGVVRNHVHIGSVNAAPRDFADAIKDLDQLRQSHGRQLSALLTDRVSPDEALWHYEQRRPQGIKTVVAFE